PYSQLSLLSPQPDVEFSRNRELPQKVPGTSARRRNRPARFLPTALRLRRHASARTSDHGDRRRRRRQARTVHPQEPVPDDRRRNPLRRKRRIGNAAPPPAP